MVQTWVQLLSQPDCQSGFEINIHCFVNLLL